MIVHFIRMFIYMLITMFIRWKDVILYNDVLYNVFVRRNSLHTFNFQFELQSNPFKLY